MDKIQKGNELEGICVVVENVSMKSPERFGKPGGGNTILSEISIVAKPGEVTAIVGPSGSGKTSLLNLIAKRTKVTARSRCVQYGCTSNQTKGRVLFNGESLSREQLKPILNYVMSTDRHLPYLTVEETVRTVAYLKLKHLNCEAVNREVERVIAEVGLQFCRNVTVGGEWRKGISTGERRRLSIALELLDEPDILLLDEPTSGLDSAMAVDILRLISEVARKGKTVICTVHQPRAHAFMKFDKVACLGEGQLLYFGSPHDARDYFASVGLHCPKDYNVADFLVEVVRSAIDNPNTIFIRDAPTHGSTAADKHDVEQQGQIINTTDFLIDNYKHGISPAPAASDLAAAFKKSELCTTLQHQVKESSEKRGYVTKDSPIWLCQWSLLQWISQVGVLCKRSFLNSVRNPMVCVVMLLIQICQGLLLGGIFFQLSAKVRDVQPVTNPLSINVTAVANQIIDLMPLIRLGEHGADGKESHPLYDLASRNSTRIFFHDFIGCAFKNMKLEPEYPDYSKPWPKLTVTSAESPKPEPPKFDASVIDIVHLIQIMDHFEYHFDWKKYTSKCGGQTGMDLVFCVLMGALADPDFVALRTCLAPPTPPTSTFLAETFYSVPRVEATERRALRSREEIAEMLLSYQARNLINRVTGNRRLTSVPLNGNFITYILNALGNPQLTKLYELLHDSLVGCTTKVCQKVNEISGRINIAVQGFIATLTTSLNIAGCLFFVVAYLGLSSYDALLTFPQERAQFNRETATGLYNSLAYFIGKNIADLPFQVGPALALVTVYYWMVGLSASATSFFTYFGICALVSFAAYGFGYMISAACPKMETAVLLAPMLLVLSLVLAGFFLRDPDIPVWIRWARYLSIYRWGFFGLVANQFPVGGTFGALPNTVILNVTGVTETSIGLCAVYLVVLAFAFRIVGYVLLALTNRHVGLEK